MEEVAVVHDETLVRLSVQTDGLDVAVGARHIRCQHREGPLRVLQSEFAEEGRANVVVALTVCDGVEPHCREDEPSGHLPTILVAAYSFGSRVIEVVADIREVFLGLPGLSREVIHINGVVTGFVSVCILPDHARDVACGVVTMKFHTGHEETVKLVAEGLSSSEKPNESFWVVGGKVVPLPTGAFAEVVSFVIVIAEEGVEILSPCAVAVLASHEVDATVEDVLVPGRPFHVFLVVVFMSEHSGHLCDTPVVVAIFERLGHRGDFLVTGYVVVLQIVATASVVVEEVPEGVSASGCFHRLEETFCIETPDALRVCVSNDGHGMVTNHAHVLHSSQCPDGKLTTMVIVGKEGLHDIACHLWIENGHERILCSECVPKAEDTAVVAEIPLVDLGVTAAVSPVHIAVELRLLQRK